MRLQTFGHRLDRSCGRACAAIGCVEPGVHHERAVRPDDGPDEIGERLKDVVRVAEQEVLGRLPVVVRIPHRINLVNVVGHI